MKDEKISSMDTSVDSIELRKAISEFEGRPKEIPQNKTKRKHNSKLLNRTCKSCGTISYSLESQKEKGERMGQKRKFK